MNPLFTVIGILDTIEISDKRVTELLDATVPGKVSNTKHTGMASDVSEAKTWLGQVISSEYPPNRQARVQDITDFSL